MDKWGLVVMFIAVWGLHIINESIKDLLGEVRSLLSELRFLNSNFTLIFKDRIKAIRKKSRISNPEMDAWFKKFYPEFADED